LDLIGLANSIAEAVTNIDLGRKSWAVRGKAEDGRISYEEGISKASSVFKHVQASKDPLTLILAEYTFICQELQLCSDTDDKNSLNSLTVAKQNFDDASLALQIVEDSVLYQAAEKTYSHQKEYRTSALNGYPKDAFHVACGSHKARCQNALKVFGIDPIEKDLLKQRLDNLSTAKNAYMAKQKKALESR
jgi:hypothetical protein